MFVVFVTRTNAEEQRLCYARSLAMLRDKNLTVDRLRMPVSQRLI